MPTVSAGEEMIQMNNQFTKYAESALNHALEIAGKLGHSCVGSEHLLLGLLSESGSASARVLNAHGIDYDQTVEELKKRIEEDRRAGEIFFKNQ